ncbi:MAG TPA: hypothetical protein PLL09_09360 [Flavobacterium sp.]|uniref:hypothetical protein n=1 Tax=unclassified Flavobacterium TaxID=196869 RepID=UPI000E93B5A4|nr:MULTISPECIES: hypothetical protein [unclassified Flavobacterium]HBI00540.1 hypothetical protein [Flavobacterium sp.]HRE78017.1 hypothetical protein [Flavobacterium sp.]
MKTLKYTFFLTLIVISFSCSKEDEEFYNAVYTTIPGLVTIEVQPNYEVNDVLWINTNSFSRYLSEPNQTTPLDVYRTTNSQKFSFIYSLERQVDGNWENVAIGNNFVQENGSTSIGNYVTANAIYNSTTETYEFRGGLRLLQTGQYRIGFFSGYNGSNFDIISDSGNRSTFLTIATTAINANNGFYNFTVN